MIKRRNLLRGSLTLPLLGLPRTAGATAMSSTTAYAFSFNGLDGGIIPLAEHAGHPIMVVNTASQCGYTPQYAGLQQLWARFSGRGFFLLGVPCNDFGGQEPGSAREIEATAKGEYHITFPLTHKAQVKGPDAHPFYRWAALERPAERPRWNFHKYLIGRDGRIKAVFASAVEPTEPRIIAAIESELAAT